MSQEQIAKFSLYALWIIALIATSGSLFFSEVMSYVPCTLCWYQRLCMYPLVLIGLVGILKQDKAVFDYGILFVFLGLFFAIYHNLIHYGIIPEEASPCVMGIPCSTKYIQWLGFITIPMLSLFAFLLIALFFILYKKATK